ncbi:MAG: hypothetical protein KGJ90_05430 [Patescibacteria group bacterium]|nr:hypothetical protein [Patescibacteria group bacterium]
MDNTTLNYVVNAPYFWLSMGLVAGVSVFVGAIIYDGDLKTAWKGIISILTYGFFIFEITFTRILHLENGLSVQDPTRYGGLLTILFVTIFWVIGMLLGVFASKKTHKRSIIKA